MAFRVELSDRAQRDIAAIYDWLCSQRVGEAGERWFVGLRDAIASRSNLPVRCPIAPENREAPVEVRHLLYGQKPHVYRILFAVEGDRVQILHVRHSKRRPVSLTGKLDR